MNLPARCVVIALSLSAPCIAQVTPIISTFAGTGNEGASGDGGPASAANIGYPWYITTDRSGNLYFSEDDGNGGRIRRVDALTGTITTVVGGGSLPPADGITATSVQIGNGLYDPMAIDANGNIFFGAGSTIWRVDAGTGLLSRYAGGNLPTEFQPLLSPLTGLPVTDRVSQFSGWWLSSGDGGLATDAVITGVGAMTFDPTGNLVFCDGILVRRIDHNTGVVSRVAGNNIWQMNWDGPVRFPSPGYIDAESGPPTGIYSGDGTVAITAGLSMPSAIAFDATGNLYIYDIDFSDSDYLGNPIPKTHTRVRRIDASTGIIDAYAGSGVPGFSGDGGPALQANVDWGDGLSVDSAGNLYIADDSTGVVRRVDAATGIITTVVGTPFTYGFGGDGGPATSAVLGWGGPIAFDHVGNLYIADYGNLRVRKATGFNPDAPPSAVAGPDQSIHARGVVSLDGSESFDDNTPSAALGYFWSFVSVPAGSAALLSSPNSPHTTFTADRAGSYVVQLMVRDSVGQFSAASFVTVSSTNLAPTANAGSTQTVIIGSTVTLDGTGSSDPENDPLTYQWTLTQAPLGSNTALTGGTGLHPQFNPDLPGSYAVDLVVDDGLGPSLPASVLIVAITGAQFAENTTMAVQTTTAALPPSSVTTAGNQQALSNFLTQVILSVQNGNTAAARQKLQDAIARTDGCVLRGSPDTTGPGRDWVTNCADQVVIYNQLLAALNALAP